MRDRRNRWPTMLAVVCCAVVGLGGVSCGSSDESDELITFDNSNNGRNVGVPLGKEFVISLGTVGPAYFVTSPTISSDCVRFLGESEEIGEPTPGGYKTQIFRFEAVSVGPVELFIARQIPELPGFSLTLRVFVPA